MKKTDAIKHFGTAYKLAKALAINQSAVTRWRSVIPELQARRLHDMTRGKLQFDWSQYQ